jgi:O-antigen/teichoic acid export membrane protein
MKAEAVKIKAIASVKWSALTEVVSRAVTPITFVILARILTPQDFGIIAIAQIAISFCYLFWDAGLQKALIQTREPLEKAANVVFWINLALGLAIYAVLFATAPLLATFFVSPAACAVLRVLGLQIVIGSLSTVQEGLFLRDFNFKLLFWARLATAALPALVSIPLAYFGYGVWAIVISSLVGIFINLIILWVRSPWRPQFCFDTGIARKMTHFGSWIVVDSLIGWFISQGDAVVVGRFLGIRDLGLYRTSRNIIAVIFALTLNPIYPMLYPAFSALHGDKEAFRSVLHKTNRIIMSLTLPIGAGIMCIATPLVAVVLGEKWRGIETVLSIMSLQMALGWLVGANPEIYRAMGRPDVQTKIALISLPLYLLVYLIAAPFGLTVFVLACLGLTIISVPIHIWMAVRMLNLSYLYLWETGKPMILSTTFMVLTISGIKWLLEIGSFIRPPIVDLFAFSIIGILVYVGSLWLLDKSFVLQTRNMVRKSLAPNGKIA